MEGRATVEPPTVTRLFLVAVVAIIIGFDVWMLNQYGPDATITGVIRSTATEYPLITCVVAFAMGAHFGHLFLR